MAHVNASIPYGKYGLGWPKEPLLDVELQPPIGVLLKDVLKPSPRPIRPTRNLSLTSYDFPVESKCVLFHTKCTRCKKRKNQKSGKKTNTF